MGPSYKFREAFFVSLYILLIVFFCKQSLDGLRAARNFEHSARINVWGDLQGAGDLMKPQLHRYLTNSTGGTTTKWLHRDMDLSMNQHPFCKEHFSSLADHGKDAKLVMSLGHLKVADADFVYTVPDCHFYITKDNTKSDMESGQEYKEEIMIGTTGTDSLNRQISEFDAALLNDANVFILLSKYFFITKHDGSAAVAPSASGTEWAGDVKSNFKIPTKIVINRSAASGVQVCFRLALYIGIASSVIYIIWCVWHASVSTKSIFFPFYVAHNVIDFAVFFFFTLANLLMTYHQYASEKGPKYGDYSSIYDFFAPFAMTNLSLVTLNYVTIRIIFFICYTLRKNMALFGEKFDDFNTEATGVNGYMKMPDMPSISSGGLRNRAMP